MSKFYEPDVQPIVEHNRELFQPDAEAVEEALEFLRNNPGAIPHSYDSINDQENEDIRCEPEDNNSMPSEQSPDDLAPNSDQPQQPSSGLIVS